jgi:hypothetical protein
MPGSGATAGDDEKDGRLMLPHAPRNIVSTEAIPRLATARTLTDLIMVSPEQIRGRTRPAAKRKNAVGAMTSTNYAAAPIWFPKASYIRLTKGLTALLDRIGGKPYSPARI